MEELLAGLGAAARLFGELEDALREPAPAMVELDTPGAFRFLKETGPLLAGAGFGVLLPDWVRKARLGLKLTTRSQAAVGGSSVTPGRFGLGDLVDFRYDVAVGDQVLDPAELAELARLKVPLVRLRGQWVELDEAHLQAALKFLERQPGRHDDRRRRAGGRAGAAAGAEVPLVDVDADGWLGDLLSGQADRRLAPMTAPAGFAGTLRPYQERGLSWLSFLGGLGPGRHPGRRHGPGQDDPAAVADRRAAGRVRARPCWCARCRWSATGSGRRPGSPRTCGSTCTTARTGWTAGPAARRAGRGRPGHHQLRRGARDQAALSTLTWARVVCDEAQNIKNHATKQARAVRALPAATRIALTGTPVENRLSRAVVDHGVHQPGPARAGRAVPGGLRDPDRAARLGRRRAGAAAADPAVRAAPPEDRQDDHLRPAGQAGDEGLVQPHRRAGQPVRGHGGRHAGRIEEAADDISRRGLVLATMAKLKQVCNHPAHLLGDGSRLPGRSGKLARLEEICDEIVAEGDKALCFTQYAEFGRMLQPHLAARLGCPVLFLHGGTPKKQRDAMVETFASLTSPRCSCSRSRPGGTGLNLTAASHVIHVDRWWNPAVEDQATDRAFRIGQRRNVQVRKFVCVGTLEERIDAMIEEKKALAERVVGTGESWLTELSVADLRAVLALSPDAVSE